MKKLFLLFLTIGLFQNLMAQYFQTGQDPASLKWRQILTENFQIIYPDYYEFQAQSLASEMEMVYRIGSKAYNHKPKKISIILHTQTVKSNGLVAWAPKRAEFFTIPHQGIYAQDWIQQLAIHEFHHVLQTDKINSEMPKILKIVLGEQATPLVFGAYFPWWFIEGDAVVAETAFSNWGRGRFPSFLMEHKALAIEKGNYKYDKAYNGSYKDYVPNHYQLGYYLVGKSKEKYGAELWNAVVERVGKRPFSLNPFNKALKQNTGLNKVQLYDSVFQELKDDWLKEDERYTTPDFRIASPENNTYASYNYNHWLNDSTIVSYKTALNQIPSFIKIDKNRKEKKIIFPGVIFDESVNYRGEWLVYSEQIPDPRWHHSGKSYLRFANLENGIKMTMIPEFTAFTPSISPDLNNVAVIETNFSSDYFLSVYRISDGQLVNRFQTKNNNYFFSPEWLNKDELIVVVLLPEGKRLARYNLKSKNFEILLEQDFGEIKNLRVSNNDVYFVGSYTGKNSLFRYNLEKNRVFKVYEARFGLESPAFSSDGNDFVISDYTSKGFRLLELNSKNLDENKIENVERKNYSLAENLANMEEGVIDFSKTDTIVYDSKKYSKIRHLFHFHSWAPAAVDVLTYEIQPGISVMSQNKLGTSFTNLGYEWNITERAGSFYGKYSFRGWYPVIDLELRSGNNASEITIIEQTKKPDGEIVKQDTILKRYTWLNTTFSTDFSLPLNLSRGKYSRLLQPEIRYSLTNYKHNSTTYHNLFEGTFQSLTYRLYFSQLLRRSWQDVYPDFGIILDGIYRHSPLGETNMGSLSLGQAYLFLPGLLPNHGIRLYGGVQDKTYQGALGFADLIRYPRGWGKINTNTMYSFASDYKFPVFYPEWSIGGLVYVKRVNASVFADLANLTGNVFENGKLVDTFETNISSVGAELTANANFLRFYAPVEIGFRTSYLPKRKEFYFNFLFSIDFHTL